MTTPVPSMLTQQARRLQTRLAHVFRDLWVAYPSWSVTPRFDRAIFVTAKDRDAAKKKMIAILRSIVDQGYGLPNQWDDEYILDNLSSFEECLDMRAPQQVATSIFGQAALSGSESSWCEQPIFAVDAPLAGLLADLWSSLPRGSVERVPALSAVRITRAQAMQSINQHAEHRRLDVASADFIARWLTSGSTEVLHVPEASLTALFGKPDASLGDLKGPHWAIRFDDGVVVHIYAFRSKRHRSPGMWDVMSFDSRGPARVRCVLDDEAVRSSYQD